MSSEFGQQCLKLIESYKEAVAKNPDLTLKSHSESNGMVYRRVIDWTSRRGIFVREIKGKAIGGDGSRTFVPITVSQSGHMSSFRHNLLSGVSIGFPDGVSLRLEECGVEELISLLTLYDYRRTGKEVPCSL